ncbi:hypothetical protein [Streptomyces sp. NBC_00829]|uniref:hypothetical protein n=1 Tax=Streptomyces sp. NBC_00829 TaxID=2903679 RepID=UPI0038684FFE|nr:hypothetical protein OG293_36505 [Streptomyces sp. NBC_00829]
MSGATCVPVRSVGWAIWVRQLKRSARMYVSGAAARTSAYSGQQDQFLTLGGDAS